MMSYRTSSHSYSCETCLIIKQNIDEKGDAFLFYKKNDRLRSWILVLCEEAAEDA